MTVGDVIVTQAGAIRFLEHAFRNIELPPLSHDDIADVTNALRKFAATPVQNRGEDELLLNDVFDFLGGVDDAAELRGRLLSAIRNMEARNG